MSTRTSTINVYTPAFDEVRQAAFWTTVRSAFTASGWVQTSDTGQQTLLTPSGGNQEFAGYFIFKLNDAMVTTAPIFARVNLLKGFSAGDDVSRFTIQFGSGTDGAGNITGATWTTPITDFVDPNVDQVRPLLSSWAEGRSSIVFSINTASNIYTTSEAVGVFVQRTHDTDGNPTADGFFAMVAGCDGHATTWPDTFGENAYDYSEDAWRGSSENHLNKSVGAAIPCGGRVGASGNEFRLAPWIPYGVNGQENALPDWFLLYKYAKYIGQTFSVTQAGVTRTLLNTGLEIPNPLGSGNNDWRLCVLWE